MRAKTRRKLEMAQRALAFCREHPDPSAGYAASVAHLEELVARGAELALQQSRSMALSQSASARKEELRRTMRRAHLAHLIRVARLAAVELPELGQKFRLPRGAIPYLTFRTTARGLAAEAERRKELLVRYGLTETIMVSLSETLQQFDEGLDTRDQARALQVGASAELAQIGEKAVRVVKSIDGLNLHRFAHQADLMASWRSVSSVLATPQRAEEQVDPAV